MITITKEILDNPDNQIVLLSKNPKHLRTCLEYISYLCVLPVSIDSLVSCVPENGYIRLYHDYDGLYYNRATGRGKPMDLFNSYGFYGGISVTNIFIDCKKFAKSLVPKVPKKTRVSKVSKKRKEIEVFCASLKPGTIRTLARGQRQFSRQHKLNTVMVYRQHGLVAARAYGSVASSVLYYWVKQYNDGHFDIDRAVAFSRKPQGTMIQRV